MVELAIGEDKADFMADALVVFLGEALLQGDDVRLGTGYGKLTADLSQAFSAELGDILEAPAVERDKINLCWRILHF